MYKEFRKKVLIVFLFTVPVFADINMQEGVYDSAEEMMRFDEKMNRMIAEHNQIDLVENQNSAIEDFEETATGYRLKQYIDDSNSTEVKVFLEGKTLKVSTVSRKKEVIKIENETSYETTMSSSTTSLFLPEDADEKSMSYNYKNGILEVTLLKK